MLFTDRDLVTLDALTAVDPEVAAVCEAQGILLDGPTGFLQRGWEECAAEVQARLAQYDGLAALDSTSSRVFLSQIVTSDPYGKQSVIERWATYVTLSMIYTAAARLVSESDRLADKAAAFEIDAQKAWKTMWAGGLPLVREPLPCPGAKYERGAGDWTASNVSAVSGGTSTADVAWQVAITYVGAAYASSTAKNNAESGPSALIGITVPVGQRIRIDLTSLIPPTGGTTYQADQVTGPLPQLAATGWLVYAGVPGQTLYLQGGINPIATKQVTLAGAPVLSGAALDPGQRRTETFRAPNFIGRG